MKICDGCIDRKIPPAGCMNLVSVIQSHIHDFSTSVGVNVTQVVSLPPDPSYKQSTVPSIVNTNPSISGQYFEKSVSCTLPEPSYASVASVSMNGR